MDGGFLEQDPDKPIINTHTWGLCVITTNSNGLQAVEACASGPIDFDSNAQTYIGQEVDRSSFVTELYAQAIARIFYQPMCKVLC